MPYKNKNVKVAIVMGSQSDYSTMKLSEKVLKMLKIKYETKIVSAHRTPKRMYEFAKSSEKNGFSVCLLYTSPSPRDMRRSRMPSSA